MTRPTIPLATLAFPAVALLLCAPALRPGYVLLPTALESLPPWSEGAAVPRSNPAGSDALLLTLPARAFNHEAFRQGTLPFWNPRVSCGTPHLAMIQNQALYPLTAPLDLLDPLESIDHAAWLHLALAGALMSAFLTRAGLSPGGALVGGLAFELNGFFLTRLSVPSYLYSGTWLPLMLLGARELAAGAPRRAAWMLPTGVALSALGGHPQVTSMALALAVLYGLWLAAAAPSGRARLVVRLAVLSALGLALAGLALVPFAQLVGRTARGSVPLEVYRHAATPVAALAQALVPDAFGHPVQGTYWLGARAALLDGAPATARPWGLNAIGQNLYTGVAPLGLAVLALVRARRRPEVAFFALAALAALCVLLGTPLLDLAWALLPGFRHSRPDRITFVFMAAVSVLAAHGGERPAEGAPARQRGFTVAAAVLAALLAWTVLAPVVSAGGRAGLARFAAAASAAWRADAARLIPQALLAAAVLVAVWWLASRRGAPWRTVALALLVLVPNLAFGWRFNPAQKAPRLGDTDLERTLRTAAPLRVARVLQGEPLFLPPNLPQLIGVADAQGASAAGLDPFLRLMRAADPAAVVADKYFLAFRDPAVLHTPLLRALSVGWLLSDALGEEAAAKPGRVGLYRLAGALPRFHAVSRVEPYDDPDAARRRLLSPAFDPRTTVLVPTPQARRLPPLTEGTTAAVTVLHEGVNDLVLEVDAPAAVLLVSSEAAWPEWRSAVDGVAAETLLVNTAFRGVAVPAGRHRVTMKYVPRAFMVGLALTACALVTLVALARRW